MLILILIFDLLYFSLFFFLSGLHDAALIAGLNASASSSFNSQI